MKINFQSLFILLVIGFVFKACGGDDKPRTATRASPPAHNAYTAAMEPVAPATLSTKTLYVGPKSLNVRSSPNGAISGSLKHGAAVDIYAEEGEWSRVSPEGAAERWVSSNHLCAQSDCGDTPRWKAAPKPVVPVMPAPSRRAAPSAAPSYGCSCSSGSNCYGPRGGRYCITSGGNKRYR